MNLSYVKLLVTGLIDNAISFPPLTNSPLLVPASAQVGSNNGENQRIIFKKT